MKITVTLTEAQARALVSAAFEVEAGYDPNLWPTQTRKALRRAIEAIYQELPSKETSDV